MFTRCFCLSKTGKKLILVLGKVRPELAALLAARRNLFGQRLSELLARLVSARNLFRETLRELLALLGAILRGVARLKRKRLARALVAFDSSNE